MGWTQTWISHAMNAAGLTEALGVDASIRAMINLHSIAPWSAKDLVRKRLDMQKQLATRSPLRLVPVEEGLSAIGNGVGGWPCRKPAFIRACVSHLKSRQMPVSAADTDLIGEVFDMMDFNASGTILLGEFAGGLSVFFEGDAARCVSAAFTLLDTSKSKTLTKPELEEYLQPFVQAMTPPQAESLWPLLLKKATEAFYVEWGGARRGDVFADEMLRWTRLGNCIVDRLSEIIDRTVYEAWLATQGAPKTPSPRTVQPGDAARFHVNVVRDKAGAAGFRLGRASMAVESVVTTRQDLHPMQNGDIIVAVNNVPVSTPEEYMKLAHGVASFSLTLEHAPARAKSVYGGA